MGYILYNAGSEYKRPSEKRFVKNDATHGFNRDFLVKMLHIIKVVLQGYF